MVFNIKNKKLIGYSLLVVCAFEIASMFITLSMSTYKDYVYAFSYISVILLAISFFFKSRKTHNFILATSFFVASLFEIIYIIQQSISISAVACLLLYCLLGVLLLLDKPKKRAQIIVVLILLFVTICYGMLSSRLMSYMLRFSSAYNSFMLLGDYSVLGAVELIAVLLDRLSFTSTETEYKKGISINTDIISFKDLLLFIESEYKSGNITEKEYNEKRSHILSKL